MQQLAPLDAQFLTMESHRIGGHVCGLAVLDPSTAPGGTLTLEDVRAVLEARLGALLPFRRRLAPVPFDLDRPYWIEDPDFDLDFHLREAAVPPPGTREQLADVCARIAARALDRGHPLWEVYLVHGLEEGRVALLVKIHHAAADGLSGMDVLDVLVDRERDAPTVREDLPERPAPERAPSELGMLARGLAALPGQPLRAMRSLPATLVSLGDLPGVSTMPGMGLVTGAAERLRALTDGGEVLDTVAVRAPPTRFNHKVSSQRALALTTIDLARVKAVKDATGVTVNDVVMALCSGGVRRWLDERGELPDESLVAMVPLSVRGEDEHGVFGNRVSAMFVPLHTDLDEPGGRLRSITQTMQLVKERFRALPASVMQDVSDLLPTAILNRAVRAYVALNGVGRMRPLNLVVSNVPGPREPRWCAGARMEHYFPISVVTDGCGLNITCISYCGGIDFGILGCRKALDDPWGLARAIEDELGELEAAVAAA